MSDELDPQLLRLFAGANEPLPDAEFHARVMASVQRPPGWRGIAQATASMLFSISSGVVAARAIERHRRQARTELVVEPRA